MIRHRERQSAMPDEVRARYLPDCVVEQTKEQGKIFRSRRDVKYILGILSKCAGELRDAIAYTERDVTYNVTGAKVGQQFLAPAGAPDSRKRSADALNMLKAGMNYFPLHHNVSLPISTATIQERSSKITFASRGGAEQTFERIRKYAIKFNNLPVMGTTKAKAVQSIHNCGLYIPISAMHDCRPRLLEALSDDDDAVYSARHSGLGLVVGKTRADPEADAMCTLMAKDLRAHFDEKLESFNRDVDKMYRYMLQFRDEHPSIFACRGKAKADYMDVEKVTGGMMRFYIEGPGAVYQIIQQATQVRALHSKNIIDGSSSSSLKASLCYGGAHQMIVNLDAMLKSEGWARTNYGDDSIIFYHIYEGGVWYTIAFDADMSSFDWTQSAGMKQPHVDAHADELMKVDIVSGLLWKMMATSRDTVMADGVVFRSEHGGPSGLPDQTELNETIMDDVLCTNTTIIRRTRRPEGGLAIIDKGRVDEITLKKLFEDTCTKMGFSVKVANLRTYPGERLTIMEVLKRGPILYLGYYFHVASGPGGYDEVRVMADLTRLVAQARYPRGSHTKGDVKFKVSEMIRLASIAIGMGSPMEAYEPAVSAMRQQLIGQIEAVLNEYSEGQLLVESPIVEVTPWGPEFDRSLRGLYRVLTSNPSKLYEPRWDEEGMVPPPGVTQMIAEDGESSWVNLHKVKQTTTSARLDTMQGDDFKLGLQPRKPPGHMRNWGKPTWRKNPRITKRQLFRAGNTFERGQHDERDYVDLIEEEYLENYDESDRDDRSDYGSEDSRVSDVRPQEEEPVWEPVDEDEIHDLLAAGASHRYVG